MRQKGIAFLLFLTIPFVFPGKSVDVEEEEGHHHEMGMTESMASHDMQAHLGAHAHMEAHMKWTTPRPSTAVDQQRAEAIVKTLRTALEKYKDVRIAEQDGFKPFHPEIAQPMYHFTNCWKGLKAAFRFDPTQPTSLLYKKTADGYELMGAMYTAPKRMAEEKLDERVPLSVARWHAHVNLCFPPRGTDPKTVDWTQFGFRGGIATEDACTEAGGRFWPQVFGWMLHVYPFEVTPEKIWAQ